MKNKEQDLLGCHFTTGAFVSESFLDIFGELLGVDAESLFGGERVDDLSADDLPAEVKAILYEAEQLVGAVNDSIKIAQDSNSTKTRRFEIATARAKIIGLQRMMVRHPFLRLDRLEEVVLLIAQIEQETVALQYQGKPERGQDGQELEKQGRISEAVAFYERLVKKVIDDPRVYKRLAVLYRKLKSVEDEVRVLKDALRNLPKSNKKHYEWFKTRLSKIERRKKPSS